MVQSCGAGQCHRLPFSRSRRDGSLFEFASCFNIHAIVTDGLFNKNGTFYVMPKAKLKPLEEIFRAGVFTMLKEEGKITDETITKLMKWRHSGLSGIQTPDKRE